MYTIVVSKLIKERLNLIFVASHTKLCLINTKG